MDEDHENKPLPAPKEGAIPVPTSTVHGVFTYIRTGFLPCFGCPEAGKCESYNPSGTCEFMASLLEDRIRSVIALPGIDPTIDTPLAVAYARELVLQDIILWRMQKLGPTVEGEDGEAKGARLLEPYHASMTRTLKLATALAITPLKRQELRTKGKNLAALMAGVDK